MKTLHTPLLILLLGTALTLASSADILRHTRVYVGDQSSSSYRSSTPLRYASSCGTSRCSRCGAHYPIRRVISGYCRAGRPIYRYTRAGACHCRTTRTYTPRYRTYTPRTSGCRTSTRRPIIRITL